MSIDHTAGLIGVAISVIGTFGIIFIVKDSLDDAFYGIEDAPQLKALIFLTLVLPSTLAMLIGAFVAGATL